MTANPAHDYKQMKVHSASPIGLVVMLYDIGIEAVNNAIRAVELGDIEGRTAAISRAHAVLGELQGALDFEGGGDVAQLLNHYYTLAREQLVDAQAGQAQQILNSVLVDLTNLREAWQDVEHSVEGPGEQEARAAASDDHAPGSWSA